MSITFPKAVVLFLAAIGSGLASLHAAPPTITNIRASQRAGTKFIDVTYNIADPDSGSLIVQAEFSANGGTTYDLPVRSLSGAVGAGVAPGSNRVLSWNAGMDWNGAWSDTCKVRLWAHDGSTPVPPLGMVYIPNGTFLMGPDPGVEVTLTRGYFMDRTEVSAELWNSVRNWGLAHGYSDIGAGSYRGAGSQVEGHPIQSVTWYDCVKWCNARSEKDGLVPCYYTDDAQTTVYRTGNLDLSGAKVKWAVAGYRLPTEAEWERAARGGLYRKLYPWGDVIGGSMANFSGSGDPFESGGAQTTPCGYYNGSQTPVGLDRANGYGLYDVAGNLQEWCWDFGQQSTLQGGFDPHGPDTGIQIRVERGGSWESPTVSLRTTSRSASYVDLRNLTGRAIMGLRAIRGL